MKRRIELPYEQELPDGFVDWWHALTGRPEPIDEPTATATTSVRIPAGARQAPPTTPSGDVWLRAQVNADATGRPLDDRDWMT